MERFAKETGTRETLEIPWEYVFPIPIHKEHSKVLHHQTTGRLGFEYGTSLLKVRALDDSGMD